MHNLALRIDDLTFALHNAVLDLGKAVVHDLQPWANSFTATGTIQLTPSQRRSLLELGNPGLKAWNFWAQVKLTQERRRLARRKRR